MSVVNRIPRSFPFEAERGLAGNSNFEHPAFDGPAFDGRRFDSRGVGARARPQVPSSFSNWCAAGLIAADTVSFGLTALFVAVLVWLYGDFAPATGYVTDDPALWCICAYGGLIGYFATHAHYEHRCGFWSESKEILIAAMAGAVLAGCAAFILATPLPRMALWSGALAFPAIAIPMRHIAKRLLDRAGKWQIPVVVVGTGSWRDAASEALQTSRSLGYRVTAQIALTNSSHDVTGASWAALLRHHGARQVVLAFDPDHRPPAGLVASLVRERVPYAVMPHLDGLPVAGCRHTPLATNDAILQSYRNNLDKPVARGTKLVFDLAAASIALVILAPLLVMIAAAVSLDGGPVFYGHKRIGAHGRVFRCLKFRSMVTDGDNVLRRLLAEDPLAAEEWARTQKLRNDPRVTWIGRILRKTSLDELPQLLNVMRMEMSLVGPRPIVSMEVPKYAEDIAYYYETRPGITGLWQVSGRSDTTYAQRVRLDSWYVRNWTIWQDLAILLKTIPAVVSGRGAG